MNRRFTDEMLALILVSRMRRARRERKAMPNSASSYSNEGCPRPRYVSNREFFAPKLTRTLANPNAHCFKRIQVVA